MVEFCPSCGKPVTLTPARPSDPPASRVHVDTRKVECG